MKHTKIFLTILLALAVVVNLTGCEAMRKKFTRKKKPSVKMPRIYQVKKYEIKPSPELYKKHFAYWASWQSELISGLGKNHKKDMRCIEEALGNLKDMQDILVPEKADLLGKHMEKLAKVKDTIVREDLTQANKVYITSTLEREDRAIKREFNYKKVKDFLRESFDE